jgi:hypothetical protein
MHFGFAVSLFMALVAIVGVFVFIPFVSPYVFWLAVAAYSPREHAQVMTAIQNW